MLFGRKRDNVKGIPDTTWKKLEHITLSERSQSQKAVHCMIALTCSVQKGCPDWNRTGDTLVSLVHRLALKPLSHTSSGHRVYFWDDENILKLNMVMVVQLCEYIKNHCMVLFN